MNPDNTLKPNIVAVVGLGNPGTEYVGTRHNVGFEVVDELAGRWRAIWNFDCATFALAVPSLPGPRLLLVKPLTFMNRSGIAIGDSMQRLGIGSNQFLIVHDDLDLEMGRLRLATRGGAGGHRGIQSIIEELGDQVFARLKIGIGRPQAGEPVERFVLEPPYAEQAGIFQSAIVRAAEAVQTVLTQGVQAAMNRYNRRSVGRGKEVPNVSEDAQA